MMEGFPEWLRKAHPTCEADYVLFNNIAELPDRPPRSIESYDFQILQIPLRSVVPEHQMFRLPFDDIDGWNSFFEACRSRLLILLESALQYNMRYGLLTFVTNLLVPQTDQLGRLLPRIDIRNSTHFIRQLNDILAAEVDSRTNVYLLDVDSISAAIGRSTVQDDSIWSMLHGGVYGDWDHERDSSRIEPPDRPTLALPVRTHEFLEGMWRESVMMFRTLRHIDSVKLVIVDLDDTLWRGVVAESSQITSDTIEGWPIGFVEALLALKRRGILLAIVSKNNADFIRSIWPEIFQGRLLLEDFTSVRINWEPKSDNVEAVIAEINVLPSSTLFIDDNPVERAAIQAAFPTIRVLGRNPYEMRRILLWSSETQVPTISAESSRRTEMVQAQITREDLRSRMSRGDFLRTLGVRVSVEQIASESHQRFGRALELINKTNQFNSTGERRTAEELISHIRSGGSLIAFTVHDSYTQYGLTALAVEEHGRIHQLVMSCRVFGLDVEKAIFRHLQSLTIDRGGLTLRIRFIETPANSLVRDVLQNNGFQATGDWWEATANVDFTGFAELVVC